MGKLWRQPGSQGLRAWVKVTGVWMERWKQKQETGQ